MEKAITKAFNEKSNKMLGESLQFLFGILDRVEESGLSINDKRKDKKRQVELDQTGKEASDNDKKPEKGILDEKTTEQLSVEKETDIKGSEKKESGKNGKMFQEMLKKRVMKDIMEKMFDQLRKKPKKQKKGVYKMKRRNHLNEYDPSIKEEDFDQLGKKEALKEVNFYNIMVNLKKEKRVGI